MYKRQPLVGPFILEMSPSVIVRDPNVSSSETGSIKSASVNVITLDIFFSKDVFLLKGLIQPFVSLNQLLLVR